jgi:iron(III) transport system ATP-binding protein
VGLRAFADRYPHEISGGQAQRVALARALAPAPGLLLLDEPFSNLDLNLRARLAREVRDILKTAGQTAVLVTHDQAEAFTMADQLGVMFDGQLAQWSSPYNVYHEPCSPKVARFIGEGAMVSGLQTHHEVSTPLGTLALAPCCCNEKIQSEEVRVLLRPDDVVHDDESPLQAKVIRKSFRGADFLYTLELPNGEQILSLVPSHHDHPLHEPIGIRLEADHVVTFPAHANVAEAFERSEGH